MEELKKLNARLEFQKGMVRPVVTYVTIGFLFLFTASTGIALFSVIRN